MTFGGSSITRPSYTTKRPSSSSSGGFFSGLQNVLGGDVGKFIGSALSNRGGSGGSSGFGSLFGGGDTRPATENRNYRGGLFSENTNSNSNPNKYPVTQYGSVAPAPPPASQAPSHGTYGWKLS